MAKMRAIDAAVRVLEKEGVTCAFGVPGAAINPLYSALKARGTVAFVMNELSRPSFIFLTFLLIGSSKQRGPLSGAFSCCLHPRELPIANR